MTAPKPGTPPLHDTAAAIATLTLRGSLQAGDPFMILSRTEIVRILATLKRLGDPISVWYPGEEDELAVANILALGEVDGSLDLSYTNNKAINARLVKAGRFRLGAMFEGVHVEFIGSEAKEILSAGQPSLRLPVPEGIMRGQRRAQQRFTLSRRGPYHCHIALPGGRGIAAAVTDVSLGGIGFVESDAQFGFAPGTELPGCRIYISGAAPVEVTLRVQHASERVLPDGERVRQIGCQFLAPPAALRALIRSFIVKLEPEG